jgi:hypothetical protein
LTSEKNQSIKKILTIEVDPANKVIRQARGRWNSWPSRKPIEIMRMWARREGLKMGRGF